MRFVYQTKVRVISGFYTGQLGYVHKYYSEDNSFLVTLTNDLEITLQANALTEAA